MDTWSHLRKITCVWLRTPLSRSCPKASKQRQGRLSRLTCSSALLASTFLFALDIPLWVATASNWANSGRRGRQHTFRSQRPTSRIISVRTFPAVGVALNPTSNRTTVFLGPNAPIGHGSVLPIVEHSTKYIIRMLYKCQMQGIKAVEPQQQAVDDFIEHVDTFVQRTAWTSHCRSWFKNDQIDGPIIALHPGSRIHWFHMLDNPRLEDYDWTPHKKNRFFYLGNGFSTKEAEGRDSAYYYDNPDEGYETIVY